MITRFITTVCFVLINSFVMFSCDKKNIIFYNEESQAYIQLGISNAQNSYCFIKGIDKSKNIYYRYNIIELSKNESTIKFELGDDVIFIDHEGKELNIEKNELTRDQYVFIYVNKESYHGRFLDEDTIEFEITTLMDDSKFIVKYFHRLKEEPPLFMNLDK